MGLDLETPSSPLDGKGNASINVKVMKHKNTQSGTDTSLPEKEKDHANDQGTAEDEDGDENVSSEDDSNSDDYIPPAAERSTKHNKRVANKKTLKTSTAKRPTRSVSKLEKEIKSLSIGDNITAEADDSVIILPNRKTRQAAIDAGIEYVPGEGEVGSVKKKKRCAGQR